MDLTIRPFAPEDYSAIVGLYNTNWPDDPTTIEKLTEDDRCRDAKCRCRRWVAVQDGRVAGVAQYIQLEGRYHPRKFWLEVDVAPASRCQGIGGALYDGAMEDLAAHDPLLVRVAVREEMAEGRRFLEKRGFSVEWRSWNLTRDLADYHPAPEESAWLEQRLREEGIEIRSFAELADDPDRDRRLYELYEETRQDASFWDPATPWGLDNFLRAARTEWDADSWLVAVCGGEYVGLSVLKRVPPGAVVEITWTGVRRDYRRRGLALALKRRGMEYARSRGYSSVSTTVNSRNEGMIAVNARLGFTPGLAWLYFSKSLAAAESA